ncbi:MAG: sensor histidine kinase [Verrucomicrobia bacterium]|nr:sensor histidine kinase [Verrucomicrobiota bacterium]
MVLEELLPRLTAHLNNERERLTRLWLDAVRQSSDLPSSRHLSDEELADHLPKVFDDLGRYLREQDGIGPRTAVMEAAREHGGQRGRQGYRPGEVLREFGVLQRIILFETLDAFAQQHELNETELKPARDLLFRFFEDAAVASTERFFEEAAACLATANQRLAEIDASRLQLLRAATHELGGLLQALGFAISAGLQGMGETERRRMLTLCERNVADMAALLEELREYGLLLAGGAHPEWETFEVRNFAEDAIAAWRLYARETGVDLQLRIDASLKKVESDRRRLRQVVGNLVSNAIKYHDPKKAKRWVRLVFAPRDSRWWSIIVEDNGIGIAPENLEAVFAEFGRGTPPPGVQGTGLGLTISRRLAGMLGGEVHVQSQLGQGSRFEVILPSKANPVPPA